MSAITVKTTLTRRDVARVSAVLVFRNPVSIMLLAVGPLWLAIGLATAHGALTRLGTTLTWAVLIVPAYALLASTYNAYRPGSRSVYEPAEWTFADDGVRIVSPDRDAHAEWAEFKRWRSAGGGLLLHTSRGRYVVIPWRDVPADQVAALQDLLTARIGSRRR